MEAARILLEQNSEGDGVATAVVVTLGRAGAVVVTKGLDPIDLGARDVGAIDAVGKFFGNFDDFIEQPCLQGNRIEAETEELVVLDDQVVFGSFLARVG